MCPVLTVAVARSDLVGQVPVGDLVQEILQSGAIFLEHAHEVDAIPELRIAGDDLGGVRTVSPASSFGSRHVPVGNGYTLSM